MCQLVNGAVASVDVRLCEEEKPPVIIGFKLFPPEAVFQGSFKRQFVEDSSRESPLHDVARGYFGLKQGPDAFRQLYPELIREVVEDLVVRMTEFNASERIDGLIDWMRTVRGLVNNTRKQMQSISRGLGLKTLTTTDSLTELLTTLHRYQRDYFAFLFDISMSPLICIKEDGSRLLFFNEEDGDQLMIDVLTGSVQELVFFQQLQLAMAYLDGPGTDLEKLASYLQRFSPDLQEALVRIKSLISYIDIEELEVCKTEYRETLKGAIQDLVRRQSEKVRTLARCVNDLICCVSKDSSLVRERYTQYCSFVTLFQDPSKGFHLNARGGLPTRWPIVIQNPFGGEHIILGEEKEWTDHFSLRELADCSRRDIVDSNGIRVAYDGFFVTGEEWDRIFKPVIQGPEELAAQIQKGGVLISSEDAVFITKQYWDNLRGRVRLDPKIEIKALEQQYLFPEDEAIFKGWMQAEILINRDWFQIFFPLQQYLNLRRAALKYGDFLQELCYGGLPAGVRELLEELRSTGRFLMESRLPDVVLEQQPYMEDLHSP